MRPKFNKIDYCLASGCGSNSRDHPQLRFHPFPKEGKSHLYVSNESDLGVKMDQKKIWEMILLLRNPAAPHHRVCSLHFQPSDYYVPNDSSPLQLYKTAIPTMNLPQDYQEKVQVCMVKTCPNRSDGNNSAIDFFTESTINNHRWILWRKALGITSGPLQIVVCSDHFMQGCPSTNPDDVDFTPTLGIQDYRYNIEEVNVAESYVTEQHESTEDPLKLEGSEFAVMDPEFVPVQDLLVKEEFLDFDEIFQSIKDEPMELDSSLECNGEHSYSK